MGTLHVGKSDLLKTEQGPERGTFAHWQPAMAYAKSLNHEFQTWRNEGVMQWIAQNFKNSPEKLRLRLLILPDLHLSPIPSILQETSSLSRAVGKNIRLFIQGIPGMPSNPLKGDVHALNQF